MEKACARAHELCQQIGEIPELFLALHGLCRYYLVRAEYETAQKLEEQLLSLAHRAEDPALLLEAKFLLGITSWHRGQFIAAREHLEQGLALYNPQLHNSHVFLYGQDPGVASRCQIAWAVGRLGYPDQMLKMNEEALILARELGHAWSLAFALHYAVLTHQFRREGQAALQRVEELIQFSREQGFPFWLAMATITHGFELFRQGASDEGIQQMRQGIAAHRAMGAEIASTYWFGLLAEGYLETGQLEEAVKVLTEAFAIGEQNDERMWEPEIHRLKGELLVKQVEKYALRKLKISCGSKLSAVFSKLLSLHVTRVQRFSSSGL